MTVCGADFKHSVRNRLAGVGVVLVDSQVGTLLVFNGQGAGSACEQLHVILPQVENVRGIRGGFPHGVHAGLQIGNQNFALLVGGAVKIMRSILNFGDTEMYIFQAATVCAGLNDLQRWLDGIGEYEDESEYAPSGCVSFMTIHQSKGLEFPVVVVGSLGNVPKRNSDPLMMSVENRFFHRPPYEPMADIKYFDFWRLYYTAFSRAQNLLVLATKKEDSKYFGSYISELPRIQEFESTARFENVKAVNYKHVYSFTSHIAVYDGCPTQYKFYKEYAFAQNKMFHTSVGSLVHATLEDMNNCIIDGHIERVNEEAITSWFELNYKSMQEQTGYYLTDEQKENALSQVIRYFHHRKDELGRVWKAEEEINLVLPEYLLQGVIDLVEGEGDTVEIVDYKTGPKPNIEGHPERVEHYKKQLEIYAYLIEKRYAKKVSRMHLYYTSTLEGNPIISFEWSRDAIDKTVEEITQTVHDIEDKKFELKVQNSYACEFCDMRYVCGMAHV